MENKWARNLLGDFRCIDLELNKTNFHLLSHIQEEMRTMVKKQVFKQLHFNVELKLTLINHSQTSSYNPQPSYNTINDDTEVSILIGQKVSVLFSRTRLNG